MVPVEDILTYEEIQMVCGAAVRAGISRFKITGGEPLVRKDCAELAGMLKKVPGVRQVTMTTNGILLDQCLPRLLENGLDAVNISLDTLSAKTYERITGRAEFARVFHNIELAVQEGLKVKLNCVLLKGVNDGEWGKLAELTEKMQLDVRFIEMMPIGYGRDFEPVYNEMILQKLYGRYPELEKDEEVHGNGPAVYYRIKGAPGSIGFISAMHGKFCSGCNRMRLTAQGKLKPCLCYGEGIDLRHILRGGASCSGKELQRNLQESLKEAMRESMAEGSEKDAGEQLYEAFLQAAGSKPQMHRFEEADGVSEKGQMVQIGG